MTDRYRQGLENFRRITGRAGKSLTDTVVHINGALNVGCTEAQVVEVVLAVAIFAGFPAAINAMVIAKQVFADRVKNPDKA